MTDSLGVSLYGIRIATLEGSDDGAQLTWTTEADAEWDRNSLALSASLPTGREPRVESADNFFGALLPEGVWRTRLSVETGEGENDVAGLLSHVGRDVAGALAIGPADEVHEDPQPLNDDELREQLDSAGGYIIGGGGSSLSGYQQKIALTRIENRWYRGNGVLASTHILKPVKIQSVDAVHAENYCLALGRELGLTTFESWVEDIGGAPVLIIERYDRSITEGSIERIHQEDMAQAISLPWRGDAKFERNDARANLRALAELLDRERSIFTTDETDKSRLLRYTTLNVAVGNTDAHAKNFSILRPRHKRPRLAPLYDVGPLALSYNGRQELAMKINGQRFQPLVTMKDLIAEGTSWGIREADARGAVEQTLEDLVHATRTVTAHESISARVPGYVRHQAQNLLGGKMAQISGALPVGLLSSIGTAEQESS